MKFFKFIILLLLNFLFLPIYLFLYVVCFCLSYLPIFSTKTAKENLKEQLNIQGIKSNILISLVYLGYVFYFFEVFIFENLRLNICLFERGFCYKEFLAKIKRKYPYLKDKGIVYILSHMANVEMYSLPVLEEYAAGRHNKIYALAQPSRLKFINRLLSWYRVRPGMGVLWTDKHLFTNMEKAIVNENASFCMLVDQKPKNGGLFIRFFKNYAAFPVSGLRMCMNQQLIVVYASAYRVLPGVVKLKMQCGKNLHLLSSSEIVEDSLFLSSVYLENAEIYNNLKEREKYAGLEMSYFVKWIEHEIKNHPEQWCWDYKKWSRKPLENEQFVQKE